MQEGQLPFAMDLNSKDGGQCTTFCAGPACRVELGESGYVREAAPEHFRAGSRQSTDPRREIWYARQCGESKKSIVLIGRTGTGFVDGL